MGMKSKYIKESKTLTLNPIGNFDNEIHQEFHSVYQTLHEPVSHYIIDLEAVNFVDSAALGAFLMLRKHAEEVSADLKIIHVKEEVEEVLKIAHFHTLFDIETK